MNNEELLKMLLEAHREIGELQERNGTLMCQIQTMRTNRIDPADLQKMVRQMLDMESGILPYVKLWRKTTGYGLADSKKMVEDSAIGKFIRANRTT